LTTAPINRKPPTVNRRLKEKNMNATVSNTRREDHRHFHPGNSVACYERRCVVQRLLSYLDEPEGEEMETAPVKVVEYQTIEERLGNLEERLRRQKKFTNEVVAFVNSLEARLEKLEKE
jgi:hypothetical protein